MPVPQQAPAAMQAAQPPGAAQQGAPFGQSSATQPTPNRGAEAAAMQKLSMAVKLLGEAFAQAGATSEVGMEIMKVLPKLSKLVVPGSSSPATDKNNLDQMQMKNAQANQQMQMMRQQQMKPQGQGQPQMPGQQAAA